MSEQTVDGTFPCSLPRPYRIDGRFVIPWPGFKMPNAGGLVKYMTTSRDEGRIPSKEALDTALPVEPLNTEMVSEVPADGLLITWFGHATVLVQMDNISVLTDPMFSTRCGPVRVPGAPTRYRPPPCSVDDLPRVDAVVISHNHYDHLDAPSVKQLNQRFGAALQWFVPTGLAAWMQSAGCQSVTELSWWDEHSYPGTGGSDAIRFMCVPSQHWSKRGVWDDNKTLWGGWCVLGPRHRFYFAGDTGYNDNIFKLIGKHCGPFDLAALPIGAYSPRWFMQCQHVDPDEAWKIHQDVQAFNSIGIHWGTFKLSTEHYLEPRERIQWLQDEVATVDGQRGFFTANIGHTTWLSGRHAANLMPMSPPAVAVTPESQAVTSTPESQAVASTPESQAVTSTPESQAVTSTPESQAVTSTPESQAVSSTPESQAVTSTPESQAVSSTPELQAVTSTPESQAVTSTPEPQAVSSTPESQAVARTDS